LQDFLEILEKALAEPTGIALLCNSSEDADTAKRKLYEARAVAREAGNKEFDDLSMSISPHSGDILYVYHKDQRNGR
jgi:hypothetical protein